ncbi:MAG: CBS domain-containing protein [Anaerolineaceae bacterium]|jgi:CBS domain-containing protein|nr:CBS domain-containing protein [Anaerolineaceae bacterium]
MITAQNVLEIKGKDIWTVSPEDTVYDALRLMARVDVGALLVMEDDNLVGIISERDYARKVILLGKTSRETRVKEIMTGKVISIHPMQTCEECMDIMTKNHIRHLPVINGGKLVGVVSIGDVVKNIIYKQREKIKDLTVGKLI